MPRKKFGERKNNASAAWSKKAKYPHRREEREQGHIYERRLEKASERLCELTEPSRRTIRQLYAKYSRTHVLKRRYETTHTLDTL